MVLQMVSEHTSPSTMWFGNEPSGSCRHVIPEAEDDEEWLHVTPEGRSGCWCTGHDNETLLAAYREKLNSHQNERDPEVV